MIITKEYLKKRCLIIAIIKNTINYFLNKLLSIKIYVICFNKKPTYFFISKKQAELMLKKCCCTDQDLDLEEKRLYFKCQDTFFVDELNYNGLNYYGKYL